MADKKKKKINPDKSPPVEKINGHDKDPSKQDSRKIILPEHIPTTEEKGQPLPEKISLDSDEIKGQTSKLNEQDSAIANPKPHAKSKTDGLEARKSTTRIPLISALPVDESTQTIDEAKKKKTTRIDLPFLPPDQQSSIEEKPQRSSTIRIKKPGNVSQGGGLSPTSNDEGKAETAQLDLPLPSNKPRKGPKKITIKRSGTSNLTSAQAESEVQTIAQNDHEVTVENVYVILSLAAVMLTLILIYLLVGQTYAPELPFPGRI